MQAPRDENRIPTILAASNTDGLTPSKVYTNTASHALKVSDGTTGSDLSGNAKPVDENRVPIAMAVSSVDGKTPVMLYADNLYNLLIKSS